jgi:hypothetical protein
MFERSSSELLRSEVERLPLKLLKGGAKGKNQNQNRQQDGLIANRSGDHKPNACGTWNPNHGRYAPRRYWCAYQTIFLSA